MNSLWFKISVCHEQVLSRITLAILVNNIPLITGSEEISFCFRLLSRRSLLHLDLLTSDDTLPFVSTYCPVGNLSFALC